MTDRARMFKAKEIIRVLKRLGFEEIRRHGSHRFFKSGDGRMTTIPDHRGEDISRGMLRTILEQSGISIEEFLRNL